MEDCECESSGDMSRRMLSRDEREHTVEIKINRNLEGLQDPLPWEMTTSDVVIECEKREGKGEVRANVSSPLLGSLA